MVELTESLLQMGSNPTNLDIIEIGGYLAARYGEVPRPAPVLGSGAGRWEKRLRMLQGHDGGLELGGQVLNK